MNENWVASSESLRSTALIPKLPRRSHSSKEKFLNEGCPQGSVSGPFLWNVIINDFLEKILAFSSCETIAFADDLLLCFQGKSFHDICRQAQLTLDFASTWTKNFKLEFNAVKSKVMFLEKREKNALTSNLTLNGFSLDCVKELKYLGVVLDIVCFTDGSKINTKVGLAFVIFQDFIEIGTRQFRIRDECSVFQAELLCIAQAVSWICNNEILSSNFLIRSDSLSSLCALNNIYSPNKLIVKMYINLDFLRSRGVQVFFSFVRGHTGIYGNENVLTGLQKKRQN
ncbi:uncharacterized protein TNCV_3885591 [Trichonephila clavipes]|nr:uncharacterized protein TNCV_3885591 [Trichonephila clavipes]